MNKTLVFSYLTLRKIVGLLGISFPVILILGSIIAGGCNEIQSSISEYYHTIMRDIFVGVLCIVAFFLFAYNGYEKADKIAGSLASFFALGIAFFPTTIQLPINACSIEPANQNKLAGSFHYIFAALLFLTLAYFSLYLFPKSRGYKTKEKIMRNRIYKTCGYIMLTCIVLLALYFLFFENSELSKYKPVFFLEGASLWAFGISWLIKGEFLLKDK